jgi:hypothetical protein
MTPWVIDAGSSLWQLIILSIKDKVSESRSTTKHAYLLALWNCLKAEGCHATNIVDNMRKH